MNAGGFHASFLPGFAVLARRSSFVFGGSAAETRTRAGNPSSCALGHVVGFLQKIISILFISKEHVANSETGLRIACKLEFQT